MTDAEAKERLERTLCEHYCVSCEAMRHALQAIEDRTVLVSYMDMTVANRLDAFDAARRHMEGK